MLKLFKNIFKKTEEVSILKKLMDNPEKFMATMMVIDDSIMIQIKERKDLK